jgi:hypothetical protein
MESNKLLEEAKIKYPIGIKFISPENGNTYTVTLNDTIENTYYLSINKRGCLAVINITKTGQYLCYNGKWAERIYSPVTVKEDYKYLIKIFKKLKIK